MSEKRKKKLWKLIIWKYNRKFLLKKEKEKSVYKVAIYY